VTDEEEEQFSNHTFVYGFRDALKEFTASRASSPQKESE
jgi:hypothetical protein